MHWQEFWHIAASGEVWMHLMSPLAPLSCSYVVELAVANLIGLLEYDRQPWFTSSLWMLKTGSLADRHIKSKSQFSQVRYQLVGIGWLSWYLTFLANICLFKLLINCLFKVAQLQKKSYLISHQVLTSVVCIVVWSLCLQQNTRSCIKEDYLWQSYRTGNHMTTISIAKCLGKWQLQWHQRNKSVLFLE